MTEWEWFNCEDARHILDAIIDWGEASDGTRSSLISERKLRLFVCACARSGSARITDPVLLNCVTVGERFADGDIGKQELCNTFRDAKRPDTKGSGAQLYDVRACCDPSAFEACFTVSDEPCFTPLNQQAIILRDIVANPFYVYRDPWIDIPDYAPTWIDEAIHSMAGAAFDERLPNGQLDPTRLLVLADALEEAGLTDHAPIVRNDCPGCDGTGDETSDGQGRCPSCRGTGKQRFASEVSNDQRTVMGCCNRHADNRACDCLTDSAPDRESILLHLRSPGPHYRGCWAIDLLLGKE